MTGVQPVAAERAPSGSTNEPDARQLGTFIDPAELMAMLAEQEALPDLDRRVVLIDARDEEAYLAGHLPGAIQLGPTRWRTPSAKPGDGRMSQYVFRKPDTTPDVAHYERMLGEAGVERDDVVVVYGNHAGKKDGTVPVMLLDWLGHERVLFLDGIGVDRWRSAGGVLSTEPTRLPATTYRAEPRDGFVWNEPRVRAHLNDPGVVMYDTRSLAEWTGQALRKNARGGHLPGAVHIDYADMLTEDELVRDVDDLRAMLDAQGITPDKQIVLYCQTATRVSLPYLIMRDLGYPHVSIYDASWFEWGNQQDTPIECDGEITPG
ncbi:MAG: rhodanese-like domain-containing protein [Planctomycetota bacterium]